MRIGTHTRSLLAALALSFAAIVRAQDVRISEIHYDNAGTDAGETVEVSAPAGVDLTGWQVVLYNGVGGVVYDSRALSGTVPATCGSRGVMVIDYPVNGIQNGSPDGLALVSAGGAVVEFISYEGTFAATNGAASGIISTDIGVSEAGTEPIGQSLALDASGAWHAPAANTFGACNDNAAPPAEVASVDVQPATVSLVVGATLQLTATAADLNGQTIPTTTYTWSVDSASVVSVSSTGVVTALAPGDAVVDARAPNGVHDTAMIHVDPNTLPSPSPLRFNEIHYDNAGTDTGEAIEIEGPAGTDITGFSVVLYNGNGGVPYNTQLLSGVLPASCDARGVWVINYPQDGIQNGSPDGMALIDASGGVVEVLSYEGVFTATSGPAAGLTSVDIGASQNSATLGTSLQRNSAGVWAAGVSSFGACNAEAPVGANSVTITGRLASDPPLPVGFEDQLFGRLADSNNVTIATTFTWTSETPDVATVDANGVIHALAAGSARFRVTAAFDGTTSTITLPTRVAVASTTALYGGNTEFGEPTDSDPSDDFIVRYPEYTASYNPNRGSPNWVAYDLDPSHFGDEDRCDCFTADPALPSTFTHIDTNDYTNAGAIAGYGIDRGHMARSFDRTSASLDNAHTYLFDNIVPQASDLNQGPWASLENDLGDMVRTGGKEVYIIDGPAGNKGTLKNEGKVVIPTSTWKVAVILPHDHGLADIHDYRDLQVIAVNMPNDAGVRNVPWQTYVTTVDAIEALTGYDLLAALPDDVEAAVESNTQPPLASISAPPTLTEGAAGSFNASTSVDPNGTIVSYAWDFGDGSTGDGVSVTHAFAQDGPHIVILTVTDNDGLTGHATFMVDVSNVAPALGTPPSASVAVGAAYDLSGTFTDPGADHWTVSVNWGDGSATESMGTAARGFAFSHTFTTAGAFNVTLSVADDHDTASVTHTVTVTQIGPDLSGANALIHQLVASRKITRDLGALLKAEVAAAQRSYARHRPHAAICVLRAMVVELDLLVRFHALTVADAAPLRNLLLRAIAAS